MNLAAFVFGCGMIALGVMLFLARRRVTAWHRHWLHWIGVLDWSEMVPGLARVETIAYAVTCAGMVSAGVYFAVSAFR